MAGALKPTHFVVTAGRTADGAPVYRTTAGAWSEVLADAGLVATEQEAEALAKRAGAEEQRAVSDPYVFGVRSSEQGLDALSARERLRSTGPSVRVRRPD